MIPVKKKKGIKLEAAWFWISGSGNEFRDNERKDR